MIKIQSETYDIDWEIDDISHKKAVDFERNLKDARIDASGEVAREFWGMVVQAAIDAGIIPELDEDVDDKSPSFINWLAEKVSDVYNEAVRVDWE